MVLLKKGQSALEFLATYGWALLVMLALLAALYYFGVFDTSRYIPRHCSLEPGLECASYKLMKNDTDNMTLIFAGYNGLGYDIGFARNTATLIADNLGFAGRKNYTGTCSPSLVGKGKMFTCVIDITDTQRVPALGEMRRMDISMAYKNCESDPNYRTTHNCSTPLVQSRTVMGEVATQMESYNITLCGNGQCDDNLGETTVNCPQDCNSSALGLQVTANPPSIPADGTSTSVITATVFDQFGSPLPGALVNFAKNTTAGSFSTSTNTTNDTGQASVILTSGWIDPQWVLVSATSGPAHGTKVVIFTSTFLQGWISGTITGSPPIPDVNVSANGTYWNMTNASGEYFIPRVPVGTYTLNASKPGYVENITTVIVTAGAGTSSNFTMHLAPGWVFGTITNSTGGGINGSTVNATNTTGSSWSNTTNSSGQYIIYSLAPGSYNVTANKTGYTDNWTISSVSTGAGTEVNLTLSSPSTGWFFGVVTNSTGGGINGTTVNASNGTGSWVNTTNTSGQYIIYSLAPGAYNLKASKAGYADNTTTGTITPGTGTQKDFTLTSTTPIILASGFNDLRELAVDGTDVYFTQYAGGKVSKVPITGGTVTDLETWGLFIGIAVDSTKFYFNDYNGWGTYAALKSNPASYCSLDSSATQNPYAIVLDSSNAYWMTRWGGQVKKNTKSCGTTVLLATESTPIGGDMATDGSYVYWTDNTRGYVRRVSTSGTGLTSIATGLNSATGITVSGGYVYFTEEVNITGTVKKMATDGSGLTTLVSGLNGPHHIEIDGTYLYFTEYTGGKIDRVATDGSGFTTLVSGLTNPNDIVVYGDYVYWTERAPSNTIKRVYKYPAPPGWVFGVIKNSTGGGINGVTVNASNVYGSWTNTTDPSGQYVIYGLAPGSYTINASKSGMMPNSTSSSISSGAGTELNLTLYPVPAIIITACPYNISSPGTYTIQTGGITTSSTGTCIRINGSANNSVLNCNGQSITNTGGDISNTGIYLVGANNVTVTNCVINNFYSSIFADTNSAYNRISNNNLTTIHFGIGMNNVNHINLTNNIIYGGTGDYYGGAIHCGGGCSSTNMTGNTVCTNTASWSIHCDNPQIDGTGNKCKTQDCGITCGACP